MQENHLLEYIEIKDFKCFKDFNLFSSSFSSLRDSSIFFSSIVSLSIKILITI